MPGAYWLAPDSRARSAAAITSGGPSTSGKPWPRLTDPVRWASADISEKIVGGMPRRRWGSMPRGDGGPRPPVRHHDAVTDPDPSLARDIDASCRLTGEF